MKTFFKSILAVAVCASLSTACSKDNMASGPSDSEGITMTVAASSELESASASRTTYDPLTGTVSWNAKGEYLKVFETAGTTTASATSQEGAVSGGTAKFAVTFPKKESATLVYNAVYPASAWVDNSNTNVAKMKVITPSTQQPTATSFDSDADLLIAKPVSLESQPDELEMSFGRAVAIGRMTVKNLASEENVLGVKFTAPGKKVAGRSYVDMTAGTVTEYGYTGQSTDNITLNYASEMGITADGTDGMTACFTCFPFEVAAGETFTVTVTTASKIFTRTVTVPEGRALAFTTGDSSTFAVDMTGAGEEAIETLEGDYVIVAKAASGTTYAMSSLPDDSRLAPVTITLSDPFKTEDKTIIWTIAKSGDNYTVCQDGKYLTWKSDNGATTADAPYGLTITKSKTAGTYQIASATASPARILAKNTTDNIGFAFYTSGQINELLLVKAEYVALPGIELAEKSLTLAADDVTAHTVAVTLTNAVAADIQQVEVYEDMEGETAATWLTASCDGTQLSITATANTEAVTRTARVIVPVKTALGTASATLLITQNGKPESGVGETWSYTFKKDDLNNIAASNGLSVNGLTWKASKKPDAFDQTDRGLSWSKPNGVTIKTSDYTGGIKKITLVMSANSANFSTVNVTVGGQALGKTISLPKTNNQEYVVESETPLSGEIVLTLNTTDTNGKSLMIKTITIN